MALRRDLEREGPSDHEPTFAENSPLLRPMPLSSAASLCTCSIIAVLGIAWCILDFLNHKVIDDIFSAGDAKILDLSHVPESVKIVPLGAKFTFPLTLVLLQFVFMGMVFFGVFLAVTQQRPWDLKGLHIVADRRWLVLVVSHVFGTFWLQSLIMPSQVMSVAYFATSRAFEIPVVAIMRPAVLGRRYGAKTLPTAALAFGASYHLYFAYAQLAGCLCILSGNGVALAGVAFWIVYVLILSMPAATATCQEAIMIQSGVHPLLILALQNIFASLLWFPVVLMAHYIGWENMASAFEIITQPSVLMLVIWLCAQIALTSVVCIMMIHVVDSFWAIALRPLRVAVWAGFAYLHSYVSSKYALSITNPRESFWWLMIVMGVGFAVLAAYTDRKDLDGYPADPSKAIAYTSRYEKAIP